MIYCPKCGKVLDQKAKFCNACGASLKNVPKENVIETDKKTNKSDYGVMSLIFGIISFLFPVLIPLSIIGLIFGIKENENNAKKNLGIILNTIAIVVFTMIFILFSFFVFLASTDVVERIEEVINEELNEGESYQIVGDSEYGYLNLPSGWTEVVDATKPNVISYEYGSYKISLEIIGGVNTLEEALEKKQKEYSEEPIIYTETKINSYRTYKFETKDDNEYCTDVYVLQTEDNTYHAITVEGYNRNNKYFRLPYDYTYDIDFDIVDEFLMDTNNQTV